MKSTSLLNLLVILKRIVDFLHQFSSLKMVFIMKPGPELTVIWLLTNSVFAFGTQQCRSPSIAIKRLQLPRVG